MQDLVDFLEIFEMGRYEEALCGFITLYEENRYQQEILDIIYANYIEPNRQEFYQNYCNTVPDEWKKISYDDLVLDFIPVSDTVFYIFDKSIYCFCGKIIMEKPQYNNEQEDFQSILVCEVNDIRDISVALFDRKWQNKYVVFDGNLTVFCSFYQLPMFSDVYLEDVILFENSKSLNTYFTSHSNAYLPKVVVGNEIEEYQSILGQIHKQRIENKKERSENVFLSICIPTYNRDKIALYNVLGILKSKYDSEIEIIMSDNDTQENRAGYDEIAAIKDSRLWYSRADKNAGFCSNVLRVLEMAHGKFAVLASDEDYLQLDQLDVFLNEVYCHRDCALFDTSGDGVNFLNYKFTEYESGEEAMEKALQLSYMTGIVMNMTIFSEYNILDTIQSYRGNLFVEMYTHMCIGTLLCEHGGYISLPIYLWKSMEEETEQPSQTVFLYNQTPHRIEQQNTANKFIKEALSVSERDKAKLIMLIMYKTYYLLGVACENLGMDYMEDNPWIKDCFVVHQNNVKGFYYNQDFSSAEIQEIMQAYCEELFFKMIVQTPGSRHMSEKEKGESDLYRSILEEEIKKDVTLNGLSWDDIKKKAKNRGEIR